MVEDSTKKKRPSFFDDLLGGASGMFRDLSDALSPGQTSSGVSRQGTSSAAKGDTQTSGTKRKQPVTAEEWHAHGIEKTFCDAIQTRDISFLQTAVVTYGKEVLSSGDPRILRPYAQACLLVGNLGLVVRAYSAL